MRIKNFTAYYVNGDLYIRKGKPNAKTRQKIIPVIQENPKDKERRETLKTSGCNCLVYGWEELDETTQTKLPFHN